MSLLTENLPKTIKINGSKYKINTDFRIWLKFANILIHGKQEISIKTKSLLSLVYPIIPEDIETAIQEMLNFFFDKNNMTKSSEQNKKNIYDFEKDSEYIYAAFKQQYNVDLIDIEYMHWHQFRAMFNAISDDTQIYKIMQIRSMDLGSIKDKEQKKHIRKLKLKYMLPDNRSEEEKEAEFSACFASAFI